MTQPRKEQLNILRAVWTVTTVSVTGNVTSTVLPGSFVSSSVTQIPGGSIDNPPVRGIVTTDAGGFVRIRLASNALSLDFTVLQIFGRLGFSGGNYVLSYKVISGGVETTATIPSGTYSIQLMYSEVMNFGEIPVTADVIYGYNQELLPSGSTISGNLTVGGNTVLGTNSSNTLSVNAELNTSLIPTPDNTVSLGSAALRFASTNTTSLAARADNIDSIKSVLTASSLLASNTTFTLDGSNSISVGPTTTTAVNIGRAGITTTINGTLSASSLANIAGNLTVNGGSSVFNGNLNVTGTLTTGSILFPTLNVSGNSTLGTNASNTIDFLATFISSLIPNTPDTYDIGTLAEYWRNIHSTRLFTHYDTTNSSYSFLEPNNLFASVDFDIDGYGALLMGVTYSDNISIGNNSANALLDGYNITVNSNNNLVENAAHDITLAAVHDVKLTASHNILETATNNTTFTTGNAFSINTTTALINASGNCTVDGYDVIVNANDAITLEVGSVPIATVLAEGINVHDTTPPPSPPNGWTVYADGYDNLLKAKDPNGRIAKLTNLGGEIVLTLGGSSSTTDGPNGLAVIQPSLDFPNATRAFIYATIWADLGKNTPPVWAVNTTNNVNDIVSNLQPDGTNSVYVCVVGGTSGPSGSGPIGVGTNLHDGTGSSVVWRSALAGLLLANFSNQQLIVTYETPYTLSAAIENGINTLQFKSEITSEIMGLTQETLIVAGVSGDPADTQRFTSGNTGGIKLIFT